MIEVKAMFPVMVTGKLDALKQFYESVFGFNAVFFESGFYLHLVCPSTGIQLGFLAPDHHSQPPFLHSVMASEAFVLSLEVANAKLAFEQAQSMGLVLEMGLKEESWGQLHFIVRDPAGVHLDIVEHLDAG